MAVVAVLLLMVGSVTAIRGVHPAGVTTATAAPAPPVTLPAVPGTAGWSPVDFGSVRVYLPQGWTSVNRCSTSSSQGSPPSVQFIPDEFLLRPASSQLMSCLPPAQGGWASLQPLPGAPPASWVHSSINAIAVWSPPHQATNSDTVDIPTLHVQVYGRGDAEKILATVSHSSLYAVLGQSRPTAVPASWKAVRFDGLQADVPPTWPVEVVTRHVLEPGTCAAQVFLSPIVYLGDSGLFAPCPFRPGQLAQPVDGLWIASGSTNQTFQSSQPRSFGPRPAWTLYSDTDSGGTIGVQVTIAGRPIELTVGLGIDPTVAEEILSSLQATTRTNSTGAPST